MRNQASLQKRAVLRFGVRFWVAEPLFSASWTVPELKFQAAVPLGDSALLLSVGVALQLF